jgi:hypothetical protein
MEAYKLVGTVNVIHSEFSSKFIPRRNCKGFKTKHDNCK